MDVRKDLPPYVSFESRARQTPDGFVDDDYAFVTPMGSKDRFEFKVDEWFARLKQQVMEGRFQQNWLDAFQASYKAWKNDQDPPINGTSIKLWPILSPAQVKMLTSLRILSIEDLAGANEEAITRMGMGARALKDQATVYLKSLEKGGVVELTKQFETFKIRTEELEARNADLTELVKQLQGQLILSQKANA